MSRLRLALAVAALTCVLAPAGASARPSAFPFPNGRTTITSAEAVGVTDLTATKATLQGKVTFDSDSCDHQGDEVGIASAQFYLSQSPTMADYWVLGSEFDNAAVPCNDPKSATVYPHALAVVEHRLPPNGEQVEYLPLAPDTTYYFQQTACGLDRDLSTTNCLVSAIKSFHTPPTNQPPPAATAPKVVKDPHVEPVTSANVGTTATYFPGSYSGTAPITLTHVWVRCTTPNALVTCTEIPGTAGAATYELTNADADDYVAVREHAANGAGGLDRFSNRVHAQVPPFGAPKPKFSLPKHTPTLPKALQKGITFGLLSNQNGRAVGSLFVSAKTANKLVLARVARKPAKHRKPVAVAKGKVKLVAGTKGKLKLKFTRDAKRKLAELGSIKLKLVVKVTGQGTKTKTIRKPLKLKA